MQRASPHTRNGLYDGNLGVQTSSGDTFFEITELTDETASGRFETEQVARASATLLGSTSGVQQPLDLAPDVHRLLEIHAERPEPP